MEKVKIRRTRTVQKNNAPGSRVCSEGIMNEMQEPERLFAGAGYKAFKLFSCHLSVKTYECAFVLLVCKQNKTAYDVTFGDSVDVYRFPRSEEHTSELQSQR